MYTRILSIKFQIFIISLAQAFYILCMISPLGDGGGGGI